MYFIQYTYSKVRHRLTIADIEKIFHNELAAIFVETDN